ncbi:MAG: hypothetical protein ABSD48_07365 [Armatimonadota bacterium]|jgi:hypothetical protein
MGTPFGSAADNGPDISVSDDGDALRITIPARPYPQTVIPLVAWALIVLLYAASWLATQRDWQGRFRVHASTLGWFAPLAALFVRMLGIILWERRGAEEITIDERTLIICRTMPFWRRTHEFVLEDVRALRAEAPQPGTIVLGGGTRGAYSSFFLSGGEQIAFGYHGRVIRFAPWISEDEARQIVTRIAERFPQVGRSL